MPRRGVSMLMNQKTADLVKISGLRLVFTHLSSLSGLMGYMVACSLSRRRDHQLGILTRGTVNNSSQHGFQDTVEHQ